MSATKVPRFPCFSHAFTYFFFFCLSPFKHSKTEWMALNQTGFGLMASNTQAITSMWRFRTYSACCPWSSAKHKGFRKPNCMLIIFFLICHNRGPSSLGRQRIIFLHNSPPKIRKNPNPPRPPRQMRFGYWLLFGRPIATLCEHRSILGIVPMYPL